MDEAYTITHITRHEGIVMTVTILAIVATLVVVGLWIAGTNNRQHRLSNRVREMRSTAKDLKSQTETDQGNTRRRLNMLEVRAGQLELDMGHVLRNDSSPVEYGVEP